MKISSLSASQNKWYLHGLALVSLLFGLIFSSTSFSQSLNFGSGSSNSPIEIFADNGIEWQQENLTFLARGNARAIRGPVEVLANELQAYYREESDGSTEIWRLDANGKVRIKTQGQMAYGDKAVYQVEKGILVLSGREVKLVAGKDVISANKQLEYWEKKLMAVARGNAYAVRQGKSLRADVLASYFRPDKTGNNELYRIDAFDNVKIITLKNTATANRGVYNVESGIATLTGSVKLKRGKSVLTGCSAKVNLSTGVSKIFSCQTETGVTRKRAKGLIRLNKKKRK
jgi:lipopolysaccharide export system protein LptA